MTLDPDERAATATEFGVADAQVERDYLISLMPIRRRRFVPTGQAQAMFAAAPALDYDALCDDLDTAIDDELSDNPLEGTGL